LKKVYFVTGAAGFIGSNIVERLVKEGCRVKAIDNFLTGRKENIEPFLSEIEFIEGDIRNLNFLQQLMKGVDFVLHQAAVPSVPRSIEDPLTTNSCNVDGTLNVLIAARDAGVKRVIYASSSSIYGESSVLPKKENMTPAPISPYAVSKLAGEFYSKIFYKVYGLETVCLRYFNVFGPRQNPASQYAAVIPKFITCSLEGKPIPIFGDGEQSRDFTFVDNVVEANLKALEAQRVGGEVINIACGEMTSINKLVDFLSEILQKNLKVRHTSPRPGDIKYSLADIEKAKTLLQYTPRVKLKEGLKKTVEWFLQNCEKRRS
jgi:UDP-glucose 4-epimerase